MIQGFIFKANKATCKSIILPLDFCFLFRIKLIILPQKEKLHVNFDVFEITNMPSAMQIHITTSYLHLAMVNYTYFQPELLNSEPWTNLLWEHKTYNEREWNKIRPLEKVKYYYYLKLKIDPIYNSSKTKLQSLQNLISHYTSKLRTTVIWNSLTCSLFCHLWSITEQIHGNP